MEESPTTPQTAPDAADALARDFMLYTPQQVADLTGVSIFTIRRLAKQGKITHKRLDRNAMRFSLGDIQAMHDYFTAQAVAATPTDIDDIDDGPFNFTSRGKAIARNKESRLLWNPGDQQ